MKTLQANSKECANACNKQVNCKAFTIVVDAPLERDTEGNDVSDSPCILTSFPRSGTKPGYENIAGILLKSISSIFLIMIFDNRITY